MRQRVLLTSSRNSGGVPTLLSPVLLILGVPNNSASLDDINAKDFGIYVFAA
jgi:hypothetical protein